MRFFLRSRIECGYISRTPAYIRLEVNLYGALDSVSNVSVAWLHRYVIFNGNRKQVIQRCSTNIYNRIWCAFIYLQSKIINKISRINKIFLNIIRNKDTLSKLSQC